MKLSIFAGTIAYCAALAAAWTTPVGDPQGNPFHTPTRGERVPVGKSYKITWTPTSTGPVSLVLLRGPSTNVIPMYAIAEDIPNTGSYEWTPATTLEDDVSHYGIQLIEVKTGFYQYTDQFGIANKGAVVSSSTPVKEVVSHTPSEAPVKETPVPTYPEEEPEASITYAGVPTGTGSPSLTNSTMYTVPSGSKPSSTAPPTAEYTGAGSQLKVGGALVAVVAGMAFALF